MVMFVESTIVVNGNDNDIHDFLNYMFSDKYGDRDNESISINGKKERIEVSEDNFSTFPNVIGNTEIGLPNGILTKYQLISTLYFPA